jgi:UDP-N-acetyl-D-glucosamine/UDP-N-acetyl-D-galactosamine dehydrogenase
MSHGRRISVVGLGYVGLPVAVAFGRHGPVVGFDVDDSRVAQLRDGFDRTLEVSAEELTQVQVDYSADPAGLRAADFHIIAVPTPIDEAKRPDLSPLLAASVTIGDQIKRGDIVVYESTVYPGATEEDCIPILESRSGLKAGVDFGVGYSPERINPGDQVHRFETICKVVSGSDDATADVVEQVYASVVEAGVFRAASIRTAEAAKVIENTQRDLNIALMNELAVIFARMGLDTRDVLEAAGTKWNFLRFEPGLVGGHCIGVDPYYLTHKSTALGHHPRVILAGRQVNDDMGTFIARRTAKALMKSTSGKNPLRVTVLGLAFKENVPDLRNTKVASVISELADFGICVQVHDPVVDAAAAKHHYGVDLVAREELLPSHAVVLAVAHDNFVYGGWDLITSLLEDAQGIVFDVRGALAREALPPGIELLRL